MGLMVTRWELDHAGHRLTVTRNELNKGFQLEWDGRVIGRRRWSWIGTGPVDGVAEIGGTPTRVEATLKLGGRCIIRIGEDEHTAVRVG